MFSKLLKSGFIMAFVFMFLTAGNVSSAPRQAALTSVKGTVEVQKKGTKTWVRATEGMKVGEGDAVRTKSKSSVVIKWDADTMVKLTAFTNFAITKSAVDSSSGKENTTVSLFIGKTYSKVKKALKPGSSFEVSTPTAIAGVRSTYWITEVSGDGSTLVGFLEGSGYLTAAGKTVDVSEGEKSKVTGDNPPEDPKPMTEEEKKNAKEESEELAAATTDTTTEELKLTVNSPKSGTETTDEKVKVSGSVASGATVSVAGAAASVDASGKFSAEVTLKPGENKIAVKATGSTGKTEEVTVTVKHKKKEKDAPSLTLSEPSDGAKVTTESISVSGTAKNADEVTVNGEQVTVSGDGTFTAKVTLKSGENTISVAASNEKGTTSLSVKVTYSPSLTDVIPPILAVTSPAGNSTTSSPSTMVSGTTEDGAKVTVNGASVTVSGGVFSTPYTLTEGTNNITVAASDAAGNKTTQSIQVTLDSLPPMLMITYPTDNFVSSTPSLTLTGITDASAKVTIGSTDVMADAGGNFTVMIVLSDGDNTINIKAVDKAGNVSTVAKKVTYKSSPFFLTVSQPPDSFLTNQSVVQVIGFTDASATVTINGQATPTTSGSFQLDVSLPTEGLNTITIQAKDSTGAIQNVVKQVTRDTIAPMLSVSTPSNGFITNNPVALVTGVAESGAAVTVNGVAVSSDSFSQSVTLTEGSNTISVVAKDKAGNTTTVNVTGTLDSIAPILTVAEPSDGAQTYKNQVKLLGFTENGAVVKINGQQTTLSAGTTLDQCLNLTLGGNTFTITSTDTAGNVQTVVKQVMRTDIPPMIDPVPACQ